METIYGKIIRESEKAVLIEARVQWGLGSGKIISKSFWFPKSVISESGVIVKSDGTPTDIKAYSIVDWFAEKMEREYMFKGYRMSFVI